MTIGSAAWLGPHRPSKPRPVKPVRPRGFLGQKHSVLETGISGLNTKFLQYRSQRWLAGIHLGKSTYRKFSPKCHFTLTLKSLAFTFCCCCFQFCPERTSCTHTLINRISEKCCKLLFNLQWLPIFHFVLSLKTWPVHKTVNSIEIWREGTAGQANGTQKLHKNLGKSIQTPIFFHLFSHNSHKLKCIYLVFMW